MEYILEEITEKESDNGEFQYQGRVQLNGSTVDFSVRSDCPISNYAGKFRVHTSNKDMTPMIEVDSISKRIEGILYGELFNSYLEAVPPKRKR